MFAVLLIVMFSLVASALLGALLDRPDHHAARLDQAE
jgi:hypothetical protein